MALPDYKRDHALRGEGPKHGPGQQLWATVREELWEITWLAGVIGALSAAGVGLALVLAGA